MRITQNMMTDALIDRVTQAYSNLGRLQEQITSNHRVSRASDDPVAVSNIMRLQSTRALNDQHLTNIDDGEGWLNASDAALGSIEQLTERARELGLWAANETLSPTDLNAIAQELRPIVDNAVQFANSEVAGQHLFSGQATRTPPFDPTVFPPVYQGGSGSVFRIIGDGEEVAINVDGNSAVAPVLTALSDLYTAVNTNNQAGVLTALDSLESARQALVDGQTQVGGLTNQLTTQRERLLDMNVEVERQRGLLQDTDMAEALTNYAQQETVYRAALQAGARSIQVSLLDYLR